jgi:predicted site-specific integrase-resolvase
MPWFRLNKAAEYCDVSPSTIKRWFKQGLRHSRINGKPYVKHSHLDDFLLQFENNEKIANQIADEVFKGLK